MDTKCLIKQVDLFIYFFPIFFSFLQIFILNETNNIMIIYIDINFNSFFEIRFVCYVEQSDTKKKRTNQ